MYGAQGNLRNLKRGIKNAFFMKVFNKTKNHTLAENVFVAETFKAKSTGLADYTLPRAMYFEARWGACPVPRDEHANMGGKIKHLLRNVFHPMIDFPLLWCGVHTFGMHFPIDVAVLDENGVVRVVRKNMPPGHFFFWNPRWRRILELPAGSGAEKGDELELIE